MKELKIVSLDGVLVYKALLNVSGDDFEHFLHNPINAILMGVSLKEVEAEP